MLAAEELNDATHYVPPWTYNPEEGRGRKGPVSQAQAMEELVSVVKDLKPDKFTPTIITQNDDYLYVEYQSPTFGFIDDVEFWFPKDRCCHPCCCHTSCRRVILQYAHASFHVALSGTPLMASCRLQGTISWVAAPRVRH